MKKTNGPGTQGIYHRFTGALSAKGCSECSGNVKSSARRYLAGQVLPFRPSQKIVKVSKEGRMKEVLPMLTAEQLKFISEECGIDTNTLFHMSEEDLEECIYERMCDIEAESVPNEGEEESERCILASDIVTILGNTIPKHFEKGGERTIFGPEDDSGMDAAKLKEMVQRIRSERDLAKAYCIASNRYWGLVVDYADTEEWESVEETAAEWKELYDILTENILEILRSEGIEIPSVGLISVLIPFMDRNGYEDFAGWWFEKNDGNAEN